MEPSPPRQRFAPFLDPGLGRGLKFPRQIFPGELAVEIRLVGEEVFRQLVAFGIVAFSCHGLFAFRRFAEGIRAMSRWYVVLTGAQQEITTVWRLHLLGLEMFTPVLRRRIRTGRVHKGRNITRLVVRPMFPSYGFVRQIDPGDTDTILGVNGVRDLLRDERAKPVTLPDEAVMAIHAKQQEELEEFIAASRRRGYFGPIKHGHRVRIEDGGIYSGLVATVDKIDARGRIEVLFGMIRHTLPIDMVAAA
jgi:transcription antitermination factor NusG